MFPTSPLARVGRRFRPFVVSLVAIAVAVPAAHAQQVLTVNDVADWNPVWSPDASRIAFASDEGGFGGLYVMGADGGERTPVSGGAANPRTPLWSHDSASVAFLADDNGHSAIHVVGRDGSGLRTLTMAGGHDWDIAWSRDGSQFAFASVDAHGIGIHIMSSDGGSRRRLVVSGEPQTAPAWSPDGSEIAFVSGRTGSGDVHIARADGTAQREVTVGAVAGGPLSWSADGAWIAFVSRRDGNSEVYVVDAAGENLRNVSQHPGLDGSPAWAPDGRQLAFESIRDGNMEVYAVDVTGGAPVNMSNHPLADGGPAWAPDGSALAFASNRDGDWDILAVDVDVDVYVPEDENEPDQPLVGDVNADGVIDFVDLALISLVRHGRSYRRGRAVDTRLDVNEDGVVDITDLVVAAASYGQTAEGAETSPREPSRRHARMIKRWIKSAQRADDGSDVYRRGLETLDRLLAMVKQGQTVLHRNFPNPFNPETWVPFELEEAADVTLVFYDAGGRTIRRLELGNRAAGEYTTRGTAAYWDGRDVHGEPVGSGVYFVELRAGSYRQTRRLLVRK